MSALNFDELTTALRASLQQERAAWHRRERACARLRGLAKWRRRCLGEHDTGGAWPRRRAAFWTLQFETEGVLQEWAVSRARTLAHENHGVTEAMPLEEQSRWVLSLLGQAHAEVCPHLLELVFLDRR